MQTWLLAEDNKDDAFLFKVALRKTGAEVELVVTEDGDEVINYLSGNGEFKDRLRYPFPKYLFLDLKMPKVDGLEVLRWKQHHENPQIRRLPVIMLTSSLLLSDVENAYDFGVNSYLVKPNSLEGLRELVTILTSYWFQLNQGPKNPNDGE